MTVNSQPLVNNQKIVNPDGTPTDYFIRWAQQRLMDIATGVPPSRLINTNAGLQGGGDLSADRTFSLVNPYVYITQAAYDALVTPDPNTYYYTPATGGPGSGTVTNFTFTNGGGISGTITNPTTTPTLTLTLDANGIVLSKLAAATAASILGATAAGNATYLTPAQAKTVLAITAGDVSGLAAVATSGAFSDTTGTVGVTRGGTGLTALVLGDILYSSAANTVSALSGNITATKKFLTQTGTGAVSAAPAWSVIAAADVPTLNQNTTGSAATLTTPRTISITGKATAAGGAFDGSGNLAINITAVTLVAGDIPNIAEGQVTNLTTDLAAKANLTGCTFTGAVNVSAAGAPLTLNSTNSNINKIILQDNGTAIVYFGSGSSAPFQIQQASLPNTVYFQINSFGNTALSGSVILNTGKGVYVNGTQVVTDQQAAVANATNAADVITQLNALLARLRTHGLIAP